MNRSSFYFLIVVSALTFFYVDVWRNANTVSRLLPVKTFVEDGTWHIDKYHEQTIDKAFVNGHYYSEKAPLPAIIAIPFYAFIHHSGLFETTQDDRLYFTGSVVIAVIPFILIVMLIFHSLIKKKWNIYNAMLVTILMAFSSFIFIYAGTAFSHIMTGLWLLLAYIYIKEKENFPVSGFFAGLAFITEYPAGIIFLIWPAVILLRTGKIKNVFLFFNGVAPAMLFQLLYNYWLTGNPFDMLYNHLALDLYGISEHTLLGFALPSLRAMWELLFGFYRGWLFHAPVVILLFAMLLKQTVKTPVRMLADYLLPYLIITFLIFSSHQVWYGGWCFGPRHFVPATVLLIYHFAGYMKEKKIILIPFYILSFAGIIYTWMAKSTLLYSINAEIKNPLMQLILPAIQYENFNTSNVLTMCFGINAGTAAWIWLLTLLSAITVIYIFSRNRSIAGESVV